MSANDGMGMGGGGWGMGDGGWGMRDGGWGMGVGINLLELDDEMLL